MKTIAFIISLLIYTTFSTQAQSVLETGEQSPTNFEKKDSDKERRPWQLSFQLESAVKVFGLKEYYSYEGEYFNDEVEFEDWDWEWRSTQTDTTYKLKRGEDKFYTGRIGITFSFRKRLHLGFAYNPILFSYTVYERDEEDNVLFSYNTLKWGFFSMQGIVEYEYPLFENKTFHVNALGGIGFGTYQGDYNYEGTGREMYIAPKLGVTASIKDKIGLRLFYQYENLLYRDKYNSEIFNREQRKKINISFSQVGLGLFYRFTLIPN